MSIVAGMYFGNKLEKNMKTLASPSVGLSWKFYVTLGLFLILFFFAADAFANSGSGVGLARYNTDTLDPQAKAMYTLIKVIGLIAGGAFMLVGFIKLASPQGKGTGFILIFIGGALAVLPFFMTITGETVSGKELDSKTQEIINQ